MGISELRRGVGLYRLLRGRAYCSGRVSEKTNPSPSPSPLLMLPPLHEDENGKAALKFHSIGNGKQPITLKSSLPYKLDDLYFAGSSHGWLFLHNWRSRDFCMLNPISGRLIDLPPVRAKGLVSRVALSASPEENECRAMIISGRERTLAFCVPGKSTEWTPLGVEMKRECDDVAYSSLHKLFYCITTRYLRDLYIPLTEVESWDVGKPTCPIIEWRLRDDHHLLFEYERYPWPALSDFDARVKSECWHVKYLVVNGDDLYLVVRHVNPAKRLTELDFDDKLCGPPLYISRYRGWNASRPYKTFDFDVYKVDWGSGGVRYMKCSLEGLAMFVGSNHSNSIAAGADEDAEVKADCIYFSDENSLMRRSRSFVDNIFGGHDNGIYDYRSNHFLTCCHDEDDDCVLNPVSYYDIKRIDPPPMWFVTPTLNHI